MGNYQRAGHMDVSNTVDVTDVANVRAVVQALLSARYPALDVDALQRLFQDFERLYSGRYPGFRACDIRYHDAQHVLDVTLAMARLLDGHHREHSGPERLSADMALAGMAAALFHDSGYIRRRRDTRQRSGAAYTRVHVSRGERFLKEFMPQVGLAHLMPLCTRIIHYTGYEVGPENFRLAEPTEHLLGSLLGTADLVAQMADRDYLRKCRDYLYAEFVAAGLAQDKPGDQPDTAVSADTLYRSPEQLLQRTPAFMLNAIEVRLNGYFNGVHRYLAVHFGGRHLYMDAINENRRSLKLMLAAGRPTRP